MVDETTFQAVFDRPAELSADAGGRVNLIGEHTDYHDGFVLPAAIDLRAHVWGARRRDGVVRIRSLSTGGSVERAISELKPPGLGWEAYVLGPLWALREAGESVKGADILIDSDVPFGGGLSSSASVEVALVAFALAMSHGAWNPLNRMRIAQLARKAENEFCGVPCGIMDQVASACGRRGHALLIDCRALQCVEVPIPRGWTLIVADSGVKHALGTSEYARRQSECAEGLAMLREEHPGLRALRDATVETLQPWSSRMPGKVFQRLHHVVTENDRVMQARAAMEAGDTEAMGRLLYASHDSLARDYEVSCPELDTLVEIAASTPGVIGARLTGAGFGGNTINVVQAEIAEGCRQAIVEGYARKTGKQTRAMIVSASDGVQVTMR
jgi:galactokinase